MAAKEYAEIVETILKRAGAKAYSHFGSASVSWKSDGSPVTDADRASEEIIVEGLTRAFPEFGVRGEEGARSEGDGGTWFIDPIDGTSAFMQGLAHWGPTVSLVREGQLVFGAFWMPRLQEYWYASHGGGGFRNGSRLPRVVAAPVTSESAILLPSRFHRFGPIEWPGKARVLGSSAAHLALVAGQGASAAIIPKWSLWDVGCGVLLARETGHQVLDFEGAELNVCAREGLPFVVGVSTALKLLLDEGHLAEARRRFRAVGRTERSNGR